MWVVLITHCVYVDIQSHHVLNQNNVCVASSFERVQVKMETKEALKKLEEQLNCPICLDTYTDPKLLQCNHVFCRKCL